MLRLDPCRKSILVSILFPTMCSTEHFERLRTTIDPHRAVGRLPTKDNANEESRNACFGPNPCQFGCNKFPEIWALILLSLSLIARRL